MVKYKIRLGGTNEFVSDIDPHASHCFPPGEVTFVEGWDNLSAIIYDTEEDAKMAAKEVWNIEGFHTTLEGVK